MTRFLFAALCAGLLSFTGCASHKMAGCNSGHCHNACQSGNCHNECGHQKRGVLGGMLAGGRQSCQGGTAVGCRPGPLRWQQGGLDYSETLAAGCLNQGPQQAANPGPPSATVGYPYYTTRGPRDFLLDNPPSIGR